ncbi:MAG: M15 family metallopeptidase [Bacilli bacterium]|nr:M15 family metallopeptidase [Bacilli bacterium]
MDYAILVNKKHPITQDKIDQICFTQSFDIDGKSILVEKNTYDAYLALKKELETIKIIVKITSAFRSLQTQSEVYEEFTEKYGKEYADRVVAPVGTSEHHTGLAIDLTLAQIEEQIFTGQEENKEEIAKVKEQGFLKIHPYLEKFGFILRYPKEKVDITGYPYEPWHIRYVGKELAKQLVKKQMTLEEYHNKKQ